MKTILMNIPERFRGLHFLAPGTAIHKGYRSAVFDGSTDQAVVLLIQPGGCLQVLDPRLDSHRADLSEFTRRALPLSKPELLLPGAVIPAAPPAEIFGPEPSRKWCYYYEKAALAAQQNDWEGVNRIKQEAFGQGYKPLQASEYLVFIQAALKTNAWHDAGELSRIARNQSAALSPALCSAWDKAGQWGATSELYQAAHTEFTCPE
jgi:hypothetical protein